MRKSIGVIYLGCIFPIALFAQNINETKTQQDPYNKIAEQAVQISKLEETSKRSIDSLTHENKRLLDEAKIDHTNNERLRKDSIELVEIKPLKKKNESLQKDLVELRKNSKSLSEYNQLKAEFELSQKSNSISKEKARNLEEVINIKENEKLNMQRKLDSCFLFLKNKYLDSFSFLISSSTILSLDNDVILLNLVKKDSTSNLQIETKIREVGNYKQAESLLNEKFNKLTLGKYRQLLMSMGKYPECKDLMAILDDYESATINFKNLIIKLQKDNELKAGSINDLILEKNMKTIKTIEDFVFYNELDLNRYVYFDKIITQLKKRKMENADADVKDFLEML